MAREASSRRRRVTRETVRCDWCGEPNLITWMTVLGTGAACKGCVPNVSSAWRLAVSYVGATSPAFEETRRKLAPFRRPDGEESESCRIVKAHFGI